MIKHGSIAFDLSESLTALVPGWSLNHTSESIKVHAGGSGEKVLGTGSDVRLAMANALKNVAEEICSDLEQANSNTKRYNYSYAK